MTTATIGSSATSKRVLSFIDTLTQLQKAALGRR